MNNKRITLNKMEIDEVGIVVELYGGQKMISKLSTLGIRTGEKIKKISQQPIGGPVIIEVGNSQIAIGYKMSAKILVEVVSNTDRG